jgi:hypothetical protein
MTSSSTGRSVPPVVVVSKYQYHQYWLVWYGTGTTCTILTLRSHHHHHHHRKKFLVFVAVMIVITNISAIRLITNNGKPFSGGVWYHTWYHTGSIITPTTTAAHCYKYQYPPTHPPSSSSTTTTTTTTTATTTTPSHRQQQLQQLQLQ